MQTGAAHVGQETTIEIKNGDAIVCTYRISRLEREHWNEFLKWAKDVLPDPRDVATDMVERLQLRSLEIQGRGNLTDVQKASLVAANAKQQALSVEYAIDAASSYLQVDNKAVQSLFNSFEGASKMLQITLQKYHPDTTHDEAFEIMRSVGMKKTQEKLDEAGGVSPPKKGAPEAA